jgi:hypothetical protein
MFLKAVIPVSDSAHVYKCPYGMFKIIEHTGDGSGSREDSEDRNSSKMSIILVEGVC